MARPPPTPCRVCSRLCVSNKFSHFRQKPSNKAKFNQKRLANLIWCLAKHHPRRGDYARAARWALGVRVVLMLVETFGGLAWARAGVEELAAQGGGVARQQADRVGDEYDETTWSARTWMAFTTQRLSSR